jgi:prophage maintenance system killer protein
MMEDAPASQRELIGRLQFVLSEPVDFTETDTTTTLTKVRLLSAAALYFNVLAVTDFGGRSGAVRAEGLVEHAVGAAFQTFEGVDPHPGTFEKAAMLLRGITQGHPFNDGNKRTGFLLASYYLQLVGHPWPSHLPEQDVIAFCLRVSAGEVRDIGAIAEELRRLWDQPDMR